MTCDTRSPLHPSFSVSLLRFPSPARVLRPSLHALCITGQLQYKLWWRRREGVYTFKRAAWYPVTFSFFAVGCDVNGKLNWKEPCQCHGVSVNLFIFSRHHAEAITCGPWIKSTASLRALFLGPRDFGIHERRLVNINKSRTLVGSLNLNTRNIKNSNIIISAVMIFIFILFFFFAVCSCLLQQVAQMSHVSCWLHSWVKKKNLLLLIYQHWFCLLCVVNKW